MFQSLQNFVPAEWRGAFEFLSAPLAWLPDFNASMINIAWYGNSFGEVLAKRGLLLMPILLGMVVYVGMVAVLRAVPQDDIILLRGMIQNLQGRWKKKPLIP